MKFAADVDAHYEVVCGERIRMENVIRWMIMYSKLPFLVESPVLPCWIFDSFKSPVLLCWIYSIRDILCCCAGYQLLGKSCVVVLEVHRSRRFDSGNDEGLRRSLYSTHEILGFDACEFLKTKTSNAWAITFAAAYCLVKCSVPQWSAFREVGISLTGRAFRISCANIVDCTTPPATHCKIFCHAPLNLA